MCSFFIYELKAHVCPDQNLKCVAVLQSSQWSGDGAVCVFQLKGHITPVRTLAFSPDGLALASGGVGGLMNIWSLRVRTSSGRVQPTDTQDEDMELKRIIYKQKKKKLLIANCSVCVCVTGRVSAPDCNSRFRGDPEHRLDPRCGCRCLLQQVKGESRFVLGRVCSCITEPTLTYVSSPGPGCSGCELLQRVHDVQSRAGHLPHGPEEAGGRRPQHGPLHEGLPGETAHHAAGAVRLREGAEMFHFMFPLLAQDLFKEAMSCYISVCVCTRSAKAKRAPC